MTLLSTDLICLIISYHTDTNRWGMMGAMKLKIQVTLIVTGEFCGSNFKNQKPEVCMKHETCAYCFVEPLAAPNLPHLQWKALVAVDILTNMDVVEPPDLLHVWLQHQPLPAGNPCWFLAMPCLCPYFFLGGGTHFCSSCRL